MSRPSTASSVQCSAKASTWRPRPTRRDSYPARMARPRSSARWPLPGRRSGLRPEGTRPGAVSVQAGDVIGDGGDFLLGHARSDRAHHLVRIVGALVGAECPELGRRVARVLSGQAWKLGRNAGAGRTVTSRARGHAGFAVAAPVQLLPEAHGFLVAGG